MFKERKENVSRRDGADKWKEKLNGKERAMEKEAKVRGGDCGRKRTCNRNQNRRERPDLIFPVKV